MSTAMMLYAQQPPARPGRVAALLLAALLLTPVQGARGAPEAPREETNSLFTRDVEWRFRSKHLRGELVVLPGVFGPWEAEWVILPFMKRNAALFAGKSVLEIGTGTGVAGIYAAVLGARRVVVTDIEPNAITNARRNAEHFGVASLLEARLVSGDDVSAYAVVRPDERFDVVLSNPPFSLDLDAERNTAVTDTGDLGFSIVDGLDAHLTPGGMAALYYGSLFYHLVMVKYAEHAGFEVRSNRPQLMTEWEASVLFNAYLARLLTARGIDPHALGFGRSEKTLHIRLVPLEQEPPLFEAGGGPAERSPGWLLIRRADAKPGSR